VRSSLMRSWTSSVRTCALCAAPGWPERRRPAPSSHWRSGCGCLPT
jgi:hypothetical protein